ncbi:MAG: flagellar biosynthesis protein FlhB [Alphaproteobacteria bacterium]|nr:flagellar biosynthesis protein FlhB [Alphaproteobacteria bacterium]
MDDEPDKSEKTEDASDKKLRDAHQKGDVPKSQEVTTWFTLLGATLMIGLLAPDSSVQLVASLKMVMANADLIEVGGPAFGAFWGGLYSSILMVAVVPLAFLSIFAMAGNLVQHKLVWSADPVKPKWSKISPIKGTKRLFSLESLLNFFKGIFKLALVAVVIFVVVFPERDRLETIVTADPAILLSIFQVLALKIIGATLAVMTVIAVADLLYQRHKWFERQKMTIKEVRDEHKQMEGDPKIKSRIRQLRQERGRKRMMAAVPEASVVITNPTHYAVALKYDRDMAAPVCLAKGADAVAARIREIAEGARVPIVENAPLARALFASVEVDETIPTEHFKAVAKVIGYVMGLRSRGTRRTT